jgi:hypothetical protein
MSLFIPVSETCEFAFKGVAEFVDLYAEGEIVDVILVQVCKHRLAGRPEQDYAADPVGF